MGTNYYWHVDTCPTCHRPKDKFHIGKSSGGWTFSFQALKDFESPDGKEIRSVKDWKRAMRKTKGVIVDEYGQATTTRKFWALVRQKKAKAGALIHATYVRQNDSYSLDRVWLDEEGNSFSEGEFT